MLYVDVRITTKDVIAWSVNRYQFHYDIDRVVKLGESHEFDTTVYIYTAPTVGIFCVTCDRTH